MRGGHAWNRECGVGHAWERECGVGHAWNRECGVVMRGTESVGLVMRGTESVGWSCVEQRVWGGHEEDSMCVGLSRGGQRVWVCQEEWVSAMLGTDSVGSPQEETRECGLVMRGTESVLWLCLDQRVGVCHEGDRECGLVMRGTESVCLSRGGQRVWVSVMRMTESVSFCHGEHRDQGVWAGHAWNRVCGLVMRGTENVGLSREGQRMWVLS